MFGSIQNIWPRVVRHLGRESVNLLPVAQRTNALTYGVVGRTLAAGREFESHVHHGNFFLKKSDFSHAKNLLNTLLRPPEIGTASW